MGESRSSMVYDWIDDQLVGILDKYVDEMGTEDKLAVIFALEYIATPSARQLLERIAADPHYDIQRSSNSPQTLRDVAMQILCELGSEMVIDPLLDNLTNQNMAAFLDFFLAKLEQERVRDALQRRLVSANDAALSKLLELLGFFGDHTVLSTLTPYIDDPRIEIADTAYAAEQQILGMA
jgi:HEAT repeat protein